MTSTSRQVDDVLLGELHLWENGPPHDVFRKLRSECPVHWNARIPSHPDEAGYWAVTRADDIQAVSLDWETFSSELGGFIAVTNWFPLELMRAMFIGMDPPKHDRVKNLFQAGFTPRRVADHEPAIRALVVDVLDGLAGREECDLVSDVAKPVASRLIGSFMGIPPEDDEVWARLFYSLTAVQDQQENPGGMQTVIEQHVPEVFARCSKLIAERRERATDDLTSVLVNAEIDGQRLEDHEVVMGFFLLMFAGNDSTRATYSAGMRALMEHPEQRRLLIDDPALIPGAVEEVLRMFPAFSHFRRTATRDTELGGQQIRSGDKVVMWYPSGNRDEAHHEDPDTFDVRRNPKHQAFGGGGRHFCLGAALARLELRVLFEETLARYPRMEPAGDPAYVVATFASQLRTLPVRLGPRAG